MLVVVVIDVVVVDSVVVVVDVVVLVVVVVVVLVVVVVAIARLLKTFDPSEVVIPLLASLQEPFPVALILAIIVIVDSPPGGV